MNTIAVIIGREAASSTSGKKLLSGLSITNGSIQCLETTHISLAAGERIPFTSVSNPLASDGYHSVVFHGQLYNRSQLIHNSNLETNAADNITDGELLLALYRTKGRECVSNLVGDFSFILWSDEENQLICARDKTGVRSLYYAEVSGGIVVASEIEPILAHSEVTTGVNESALQNHLLGNIQTHGETFYDDINKVPSGYFLEGNSRDAEVHEYWHPEDGPSMKDIPESQLITRLQSLLETVVDDHIQAPDQTGVLMSGGVDSTAVAAHAQMVTNTDIPAISMVFDELTALDEQPHIDSVTDYCNLAIQYFNGDDCWPFSSDRFYQPALLGGPRCDMNIPLNAGVYQKAASAGYRVLLTGIGGNAFDGTRLNYGDRLLNGEILRVGAEILQDRMETPRILYWYVLGRLVPSIIDAVESTRKGEFDPAELLGSKLRTQQQVGDNMGLHQTAEQGTEARKHFLRNDLGAHRDFALAAERRLGMANGVEFRYPLLDSRIVEFVYNLPSQYRFQAGKKKYLFRGAMDGRLPETVRTQNKTVNFSPIANRGFREQESNRVQSLREDSLLVDRGYVDGDAFDVLIEKYLSGNDELLMTLWHVLAAELWLRQLQSE